MAIASRYVVAHWRGQLPLPLSYWINLFLIQKLFSLLMVFAAERIPRGPAMAVVGMVLISMAWSFVGAWRSAANYSASSTKVWGHLAQSAIAVGLVLSLARIFG